MSSDMTGAMSLAPSRPLVPRAERFAVQLPLRYRVSEDLEWREALIHNISGSGLLFASDDALDVGAQIEMAFPLEEDPEGGATVRCSGSIVRRVETAGSICFGTAIEHYRLRRLS